MGATASTTVRGSRRRWRLPCQFSRKTGLTLQLCRGLMDTESLDLTSSTAAPRCPPPRGPPRRSCAVCCSPRRCGSSASASCAPPLRQSDSSRIQSVVVVTLVVVVAVAGAKGGELATTSALHLYVVSCARFKASYSYCNSWQHLEICCPTFLKLPVDHLVGTHRRLVDCYVEVYVVDTPVSSL